MKIFVCVATALFLISTASISGAVAGGFAYKTGAGGFGAASSGTSVNVRSKYTKYRSETYAKTSVEVLYGGQIVIGKASAGNTTTFKTKGKSNYKQWKSTKVKVYAKGGNVLAKARGENYVTIKAAGKTYVVSKEVAKSIARFTPLGTTAASSTQNYINASSSGYLGIKTGATNKATVRIQR